MIPIKTIISAPARFTVAAFRALIFAAHGSPVITPDFIRRERMAYCAGCEHNEHGLCNKCACLIDAKVFLSSEQCPDKPPRWLRLTKLYTDE